MREGDWTCQSCTNHNYSSRQVCNRCHGPRPPPPGENVRSGDWQCPACGNHNYKSRAACNKCKMAKPGSGFGMFGGPIQTNGTKLSGTRLGDWVCAQCANHNYASRTECNRCKGPKTANVGTFGPAKPSSIGSLRSQPYGLVAPLQNGKMRAGDWMCPSCMNHNWAMRESCNKCNRPKNAPENFRDGDWICTQCKNHNYANRDVCNKCQAQKLVI